jgi:serine/threonine protein kinase
MFLHISSQNQRLTLDEMRLYFCEILLAMEFIHKKKVLYRDLKVHICLFSHRIYL